MSLYIKQSSILQALNLRVWTPNFL